MTTIALAKKKWRRKMENAGTKWKRGVTDKSTEYGKGMASFLGVPSIKSEKIEAYKKGVESVTPEDFQKAIRGKEDKWASRLKEAMA